MPPLAGLLPTAKELQKGHPEKIRVAAGNVGSEGFGLLLVERAAANRLVCGQALTPPLQFR